jgi:hypothetical protein
MVILGPNIALDVARRVFGLKILDSGEIFSVEGNVELVAKNLLNEFESLSGEIAKIGFVKLQTKYLGKNQ